MPDGSVRREYRPADEVFHPDSLASFVGAALTIGHPDKVTPKTWAKDSVGFVPNVPERTKLNDGHEYAVTTVHVTRDDALTQVDGGDLEELSAGYTADFDPTPGRDPITGDAYDGVQRNIRLNHVALLPLGKARAGRNARLLTDQNEPPDELRLDSDGNQLIDDNEPEPERHHMKFTLNGKTYDAGPELQAAIGALEADAKTQKDRADKAETELGTASAKADKAESERKDSESKFDARVSEEVAFRAKVGPILDEKGKSFVFDGKSRRDIHLATIAKLRPAKKFAADASDISISAYFDAAVEDWKPEVSGKPPGESYRAPKTKDGEQHADEEKSDALYNDDDAWDQHMTSAHHVLTKKVA